MLDLLTDKRLQPSSQTNRSDSAGAKTLICILLGLEHMPKELRFHRGLPYQTVNVKDLIYTPTTARLK